MRILQWAVPYFPVLGGREKFIETLSVGLVDLSHEVTLVAQAISAGETLGESREDVDLRISPELEIMRNATDSHTQQWKSLEALMEAKRPQIMHIHNVARLDIDMIRRVSKKWDLPIVLTLHGNWFETKMFPGFAKDQLNSIDKLVAISPYVLETYIANLPELAGRLELIPNGTAAFNTPTPVGNNFVYLGRLSPDKGVLQLLSAFFHMTKLHPDARLVIAGDGPEKLLIENIVRDFGITAAVCMTGWLNASELRKTIEGARAVIVPSVTPEPFGLAAIEAMSLGRPIIYTDQGALPWIAEGLRGGIAFESGSIEQLVAAMREFHTDKQRAEAVGRAAFEIVQKRFTIEAMLRSYVGCYERTVTEHKARDTGSEK